MRYCRRCLDHVFFPSAYSFLNVSILLFLQTSTSPRSIPNEPRIDTAISPRQQQQQQLAPAHHRPLLRDAFNAPVQGLDWYKDSLLSDPDGDEAHGFLEEVSEDRYTPPKKKQHTNNNKKQKSKPSSSKAAAASTTMKCVVASPSPIRQKNSITVDKGNIYLSQ